MSITAENQSAGHAGRVNDPNPEVPEREKHRSYTARYELEVLAEYEGLDRDAKGSLLRRERLYTSLISEWRGRIRTCNGVGSALDADQVERFDDELADLLASEFPGELTVPHSVFATSGTRP